jgi:hypothetical protein
MGQFITTGPNRCKILISEEANKEIGDFAETLLHELLHFWIAVLQLNGLKKAPIKEHRFINGVTRKLVLRLAKDMK